MSAGAARILDEYLVAEARAGSRSALTQLVRRWHPKLVAHAWRLTGDRELAHDAVQSAWSEIIRGLSKLREERAFPVWAFRIVSRTCNREIGSLVKTRQLMTAIESEPRETSCAPEEPSDLGPLREAIRQLPAGERAAIALYHFEELRVAEVAVALAVPVGTVKTRLMNARKKLRAILDPEGETP
ncbi:RNA polymerase sigma factor [Pontixanthobacter aestiaquae]|uniref:Sigma-70 family RNA polymerase sigma factor n=1 Tax=Pontixanthobacter aestiaquae TaxID=1509367 RepID=A0A844Z6E7_9SPHN|nr:RNA polymerase sigma factor [Pontixanthobacter aestiaquae]MDN3646625.1 RNA polymerase sigma factor [Pontixanthobacter aestiaquae]MXO82390.1 sigma-70 family RNA polymerase sigma factor [Pontixanthobacter aestiaquae]